MVSSWNLTSRQPPRVTAGQTLMMFTTSMMVTMTAATTTTTITTITMTTVMMLAIKQHLFFYANLKKKKKQKKKRLLLTARLKMLALHRKKSAPPNCSRHGTPKRDLPACILWHRLPPLPYFPVQDRINLPERTADTQLPQLTSPSNLPVRRGEKKEEKKGNVCGW